MRKKGVDKNIVVLLISTLITAGVWVGFEVYRAYRRIELPTGLERHLQSFTPTLKTEVLLKIEVRQP